MLNTEDIKTKTDSEGLFPIVVSALIENKENFILIVKRTLLRAHRGGEWGLVGGRINQTETDMKEALQREVYEEVGIKVDVIVPFRTFYFQYGIKKQAHFGVNFYCKYYGDNKLVLKGLEHDEYKWLEINKALTLIKDSNVKSALKEYVRFRKRYS